MACNSVTCQSGGCHKDDSNEEHKEQLPTPVTGNSPNSSNGHSLATVCLKCKVNQTIAATSAAAAAANGGDNGTFNIGDSGRFCYDCFRSNLYGKFRFAVSSNAMISPSDNVLVAFSGGPASRVVLQFVHELQVRSLQNFDASRDRSLPVFGVGVAFINETSIFPIPIDEFEKAISDMKEIVSNLAPPIKKFHVYSTENIYSINSGDEKLRELINSVTDVTGKEDLMEYLRILSLQKIAIDHGYTKLLLGTCTSRIACRVLEATVKGQGYSLSADIQYVDARWEIPIILPLRDCLQQELNLLCSLDSLKTLDVLKTPHTGINGLITSFVKLLQGENASRESTIVRTGGKLTPFSFNRIQEDENSERRLKKFNINFNDSVFQELFCFICNSPVKGKENGKVKVTCCASCQFQIVPKVGPTDEFFSLFPQPVISQAKRNRLLREQIEDCLLSDTEEGT